MTECPCGSPQAFADCCGPIIAGGKAPTPEAMMRSRYSAYVVRDLAHLERSLAPEARQDYDPAATRQWAESVSWTGLTILATAGGSAADQAGSVEFIARFVQEDVAQAHHEISRFRRVEGDWLYVAGDVLRKPVVRAAPKVGRNEPCPCGSGRKFKQCCGRAA